MQIWSAEIKELEKQFESVKNQLPDLEKELERLIKADDENMILLYSRRCLEVIITDLCEYELKRPRGTEPLKGIIDKLNREKIVPPHIIASMHSLNSLSTFGTHPKDFDPEQVKPVLNNLDIIIRWYLKYKDLEIESKPKQEAAKHETNKITASPPEKSIIVLPFENMSPDPDQEYFSDGLTEEIITDLSHIHDLLVISRSSAMTFKGTKKKIGEIAGDVNVHYVLEGSVRKAGNNLRITAQLIDSASDTHIWAEKYSGTLDDVFDIQEKVSHSIAAALKLKLSSEENQKIAEHKVDNVKIYECYLKARQDSWKYTEDSLARAEQYLKNGLIILGEHELLYAGLGQVYFQFYDGVKRKEEYLDKLKNCIKKIFKTNPDSANGHKLSGLLKLKTENALTAFRDFSRSYELNSTDPETILWLFYILCFHLGRNSLTTPLIKKVLEIDPLTPANNGFIAWYHIIQGNYDRAVVNFKKWYEMEPDSVVAAWYYGMFLGLNHDYQESYEFIDNFIQKNPENFFSKILLLFKYCLQKNKEAALPLFTEEIKDIAWNDFGLPWFIADFYAMIEEKEESLKWLERTVYWGMINYPFLSEIDPFLENIRGEERFKKLMERVKYEWENFKV